MLVAAAPHGECTARANAACASGKVRSNNPGLARLVTAARAPADLCGASELQEDCTRANFRVHRRLTVRAGQAIAKCKAQRGPRAPQAPATVRPAVRRRPVVHAKPLADSAPRASSRRCPSRPAFCARKRSLRLTRRAQCGKPAPGARAAYRACATKAFGPNLFAYLASLHACKATRGAAASGSAPAPAGSVRSAVDAILGPRPARRNSRASPPPALIELRGGRQVVTSASVAALASGASGVSPALGLGCPGLPTCTEYLSTPQQCRAALRERRTQHADAPAMQSPTAAWASSGPFRPMARSAASDRSRRTSGWCAPCLHACLSRCQAQRRA